MREFSENLKRLRKQRGLSKSKVAQLLGISLSAYSYYETGRNVTGDREPTFQNLIKLADVLQVSIDELLSYHVDEFARCKNLWIDAGVEVTIQQQPFEYFELFTNYTNADFEKNNGLLIVLKKNESEHRMEFFNKEQFINFTKKIEKKCQNVFQEAFKSAVDFILTPKAKPIIA